MATNGKPTDHEPSCGWLVSFPSTAKRDEAAAWSVYGFMSEEKKKNCLIKLSWPARNMVIASRFASPSVSIRPIDTEMAVHEV